MAKIKKPGSLQSLLGALIFLIAAISVSSYFGLTQRLVPSMAVEVTAMPVSTLIKPVQLILPGSVEGANSFVLTAEIPGQVTEVNVTEGQIINPGQSLIKIQGISTSGAQPALKAAPQPNPEMVAAAKANYATLARQYDKYQRLLEQGAIARRQVDDLAVRLEAARETLEKAKVPAAATMSPAETVEQNSLANLTSAIGGVVRNLTAVPGAIVQTGQPLLTVDSGSDVQVTIELAQNHLYAVHSGTPVEIFLADKPSEIIAGQIQSIFPQAGPAAPFFRTLIRIDNPAGLLKSGMSVNVRINTPNSAPVQAVPAAAICHDQSGDYIYLAAGGKAIHQQVTVGDRLGEFIEITSLLPTEAQVIITNPSTLKDGAAVTLKY